MPFFSGPAFLYGMNDRLVVITGISRGLGAAMARGFMELGWRVAGCSRTLSVESDEKIWMRQADVSDESSIAAFAEELITTHGVPDLLVNNAAIINRPARLWEFSEDEISSLVEINITGTIRVIRHFLPAMIEGGSGVVVNFSSGWGRSTSPEVAPYCASKWAIEGLTQALAQELPRGLAAVACNPGIIDTAMLRTCFGDSAGHYPDATEWSKRAVPFLAGLGPKDNGKSVTCP